MLRIFAVIAGKDVYVGCASSVSIARAVAKDAVRDLKKSFNVSRVSFYITNGFQILHSFEL